MPAPTPLRRWSRPTRDVGRGGLAHGASCAARVLDGRGRRDGGLGGGPRGPDWAVPRPRPERPLREPARERIGGVRIGRVLGLHHGEHADGRESGVRGCDVCGRSRGGGVRLGAPTRVVVPHHRNARRPHRLRRKGSAPRSLRRGRRERTPTGRPEACPGASVLGLPRCLTLASGDPSAALRVEVHASDP